MTTFRLRGAFTASLAAATMLSCINIAAAQSGGDQQDTESIRILADQQMLKLSVKAPDKVPVGQSYNYTVHVTNVTDNVVLHDVELAQHAKGLNIESVKVQGQMNHEGDRQPNGDKKKQKSASKNSNKSKQQDMACWCIDELKPGETRKINVTAIGDDEGAEGVCLAITSYTPALCFKTQFTKPELELTKSAPDAVNVCEVVHYRYTLTNKGSGNPGNVVISDTLGKGFRTESGDDTLKFELEGIEPGESRQFEADVVAIRAGEFASRAVAKPNKGKKTQSKETTVQVRSPELAVAIDGPSRAYVDRPATYTIRVTNNGDAPVAGGLLKFAYPTTFEVSNVGDLTSSDDAVDANSKGQKQQKKNAQQSNSDKQMASNKQNRKSKNKQSQDPKESWNSTVDSRGSNMDIRDWAFGTLAPGATQQVDVTLFGTSGTKEKLKVAAESVCRIDQVNDERLFATDTTPLEIISLPALLVTVVDDEDPIAVGNQVTYEITVINQGTAADENIEVTAKLPRTMSFVEGSGETKVTSKGSDVTFGKLDRLEAGERATWMVQASADSQGGSRLEVELKSKALDRPARTAEPTQLYSVDSQASTN